MRCLTDAWHVDVLVVGSQKALMVPPGLAVLSVSEAAWQQMEQIQPQAFYFDLKLHRAKLSGPDTPWTPAHTLVAGLAESLRVIRSEGIENVWQRCERLAQMTRAGVEALGLEVFSERPAAGMTAVRVPSGVDAGQFLSRLEQRFGVKLASGQLELKGKIFRIAHFGLLDELDIIATLAAIELVLADSGHPLTLGSAVAAASRALRAAERSQPVANT
jgi:aspartate aminotransferase-like enzyme